MKRNLAINFVGLSKRQIVRALIHRRNNRKRMRRRTPEPKRIVITTANRSDVKKTPRRTQNPHTATQEASNMFLPEETNNTTAIMDARVNRVAYVVRPTKFGTGRLNELIMLTNKDTADVYAPLNRKIFPRTANWYPSIRKTWMAGKSNGCHISPGW